mgnify:CR=1 FL=1
MSKKIKENPSDFLRGLIAAINQDPTILVNQEVRKLMAKPNKEAIKYLKNVAKKKDKATLEELMVARKIAEMLKLPM